MTHQPAADILNDLIQVNNERISRFEEWLARLGNADKDLKLLFAKIIGESHQNKISLATELQAMGEKIADSAAIRGDVYHAFGSVDGQSSVSGRSAILEHSDLSEQAVLSAYELACSGEDIAAYLRDLLTEHQDKIREGYQEIKTLRDQTAW
jgi:uncharacterized protein (TIGR02284 family)